MDSLIDICPQLIDLTDFEVLENYLHQKLDANSFESFPDVGKFIQRKTTYCERLLSQPRINEIGISPILHFGKYAILIY